MPLVSFQATDAKPELFLFKFKGAGGEGAAGPGAGVGVVIAAKVVPDVGDAAAIMFLLRTYRPTGIPTAIAMTTKVNASKSQRAFAESPHNLLVWCWPLTAVSLSGSRLVKLLAGERADGGDATDRWDPLKYFPQSWETADLSALWTSLESSIGISSLSGVC